MSVRIRKGGFMVEPLRHWNLGPNVVFETLWSYIYCPSRRQREAKGGPLETTEASSSAQILVWFTESGHLPKLPGALKLRLFGELHMKKFMCA